MRDDDDNDDDDDDDECGAIGGIRIGSETKVLGEILSQCYCVHGKSHMTSLGLESGPPQWEAGD
jgi:hypothetical protein